MGVVPSLKALSYERGPYLQVIGVWFMDVNFFPSVLTFLGPRWWCSLGELGSERWLCSAASLWVTTAIPIQALDEHPHPQRCGALRSRACPIEASSSSSMHTSTTLLPITPSVSRPI